jgi:hypothetical protein
MTKSNLYKIESTFGGIMQVSSGYSWERACRAAENEPNALKLRDVIRDAERLLASRSQEVRGCSDGEGEARAIRTASNRLRFIASERLDPSIR